MQEYWSGKPFSSPEDLPDPGIKPGSSALQADSLLSEPPEKPKKIIGGCIPKYVQLHLVTWRFGIVF